MLLMRMASSTWTSLPSRVAFSNATSRAALAASSPILFRSSPSLRMPITSTWYAGRTRALLAVAPARVCATRASPSIGTAIRSLLRAESTSSIARVMSGPSRRVTPIALAAASAAVRMTVSCDDNVWMASEPSFPPISIMLNSYHLRLWGSARAMRATNFRAKWLYAGNLRS